MPVPAPIGRELWNGRVAATPDAPFLRSDGRAWTFAECDEDRARDRGRPGRARGRRGVRVLVGPVEPRRDGPGAARPAAARGRPHPPARRPDLRGARLPGRPLGGGDPHRRRPGGRDPPAAPRRVAAGDAAWCSRPMRWPRTPRATPSRSTPCPAAAGRPLPAPGLRRVVARGDPLHLGQHRPPEGGRAARAARSTAAARPSPTATASARTTTSSFRPRSPTRWARSRRSRSPSTRGAA